MSYSLTPRQASYARAELAGIPRAEIARTHGVSPDTVGSTLRRLYRRFGRERFAWAVETARVREARGGRRSSLGFEIGDPVEIIGGRYAGRRGEYAGTANGRQVLIRIGGGTFALRRWFVHRDTGR